MAITSDLSGLGMATALAGRVGHQITAAVVGAGTAQAGSTVMGTSVTVGVPVTGQTAYSLPTGAIAMGKEFYFFNNAASAVTALIFPPIGGTATLNGSTSASVSVAQNKAAMFMLVANSGGSTAQWVGGTYG